MTTNSSLFAFRIFTARRGNGKVIFSNKAKTLKKPKRELGILCDIITDSAFLHFVKKQRIIWKNIIGKAVWWGGFYDRLVKSVKECLSNINGKALLSYDEITTFLTEVEAVLNSHLMTYVYNEHHKPQPLTPMRVSKFW